MKNIIMQDAYSRMEILLGIQAVDKIAKSRVAVFGLGGVGSFAVETLARCGVGSLTLVDYDVISVTSLNRELYALRSTIGKSKVQTAKRRITDIDENILVHTYETFYNADTEDMFDLKGFDYIIDALNNRQSKLLLIKNAKKAGVPVISCMGTSDKTNPEKLVIGDISHAGNSLMIKIFREELKKSGIRNVKILFSKEKQKNTEVWEKEENQAVKKIQGSIAFMPGIAGMMVAGEVIRDLLKESDKKKRIFKRKLEE